ncbi:MAG: PilZ domain-containing protein [Bdellovibrio sp.]|nr:PilZ domain-containing protein [Bdellovibrio sp.]
MSDVKPAAPVKSITDFLNPLDERESLVTLQNAYAQRSVFYFKTDASEKTVAASIDSFVDKKVILKLETPDIPVTIDVDVNIKFNIGTEVYFAKTPIQRHLGLPCFDLGAKIIQLKRRKEPRYLIPKKWIHTAGLVSSQPNMKPIPCSVVDISLSGMRLEIKDLTQIECKRDEVIKIQFQVHRRAEVTCNAVVRFYMNRLHHGTLLGLELVFSKDMQKERVASIVEDIISFQNGQKF